MRKKTYLIIFILILTCYSYAENSPEISLSAGAAIEQGNSESIQINSSLDMKAEKNLFGSVKFSAQANYGENTTDDISRTSVKNSKILLNTRKLVVNKTFLYIDTSWLYDDIAKIDYRTIAGPGAGCYFIKNTNFQADIEAGISYVCEKVDNITDDYAALRFAQSLSYKINGNAELWQSLEYLTQVDDFDNFIVNAEAGIKTGITSNVSLRIVLRERWDNKPAKDLKKYDLSLISGISIDL
jgi:putative salt-induced outer membrane protein YdiY